MEDRIQEPLSRVFGEHKHNVARFSVRSPEGEYSIEFTINESGEAKWNLAAYPPQGPPTSFEIIDSDENMFWIVESEASDVETAREELQQLLPSTGGDQARIHSTKTFYSPEIDSWRDFVGELRDLVRRTIQ